MSSSAVIPMEDRRPARKGESPGVLTDIIRERCRTSFFERIHVLEDIAIGRITYAVDGPKGQTVYEPTARDRIAAVEALARYGGVLADDGAESTGAAWKNAESLGRALMGALSDPSVRRWLNETRPEIMGVLAAGAQSPATPAPEPDYEVLPPDPPADTPHTMP